MRTSEKIAKLPSYEPDKIIGQIIDLFKQLVVRNDQIRCLKKQHATMRGEA
jgi:hypothetical protein